MPDAPRGFLHYHEDPAGAPSQVPLPSPGAIQLEGPARPPSTGKGSEVSVMHKNEHPDGSYPEFRALGKRTIKENPPEEAGSCRLKVGRSWMGEAQRGGKGEIFKIREERGETDTLTQPHQLGSSHFTSEEVEAQTG